MHAYFFVYGAKTKETIKKEFSQQKKVVLRVICKLKKADSVKHVYLKILTVCSIYILETILSYSYVKQFSDPLMNENNHDYNSRLNRQVKTHNLEFFMKKQNYVYKIGLQTT